MHIIYVGFYYLRWFFFCVPSFGQQYFAGVNWQVAKRTKVFVSKHVEASSGGRGQDKNQKKKNRPVEAKARNNSRDIYIYKFFCLMYKKKERTHTLTRACMCVYMYARMRVDYVRVQIRKLPA